MNQGSVLCRKGGVKYETKCSKLDNKDVAIMTAKKALKNIPIALASSIPGVGEVASLINDTYGEVELELRLQKIERYKNSIEKFQAEFDSLKRNVATTNEEYSTKTVKGIELFFADYIEVNGYDFIENLENVLKMINEEYKVQCEFGCRYEDYVLSEESLKILFDDVYDKEHVDEYIEKIEREIDDGWHDVSPICKMRYY